MNRHSAILPLRDYQTEAIKDLHRRWDAGDTRVPMVLATGLGKTVIFAHLIAQWVQNNVAKRVIVLVHTDELVQQAYKKIKDVAPDLHVGIVKAERNEVFARVIVASVQSLRSAKRRAQIRNVGMIIVDECHHATASTYRTILEHYGAFPVPCSECEGTGYSGDSATPDGQCWDCRATGFYNGGQTAIQVAGFTATLARGDKQKLSDVWQDCTFSRGIAFGIRRGYLLDVRGKRIVVPDMELSNVKKSGGDYADGSLAEELDRALAPSIVASAYVEHAFQRKGLGFAPTVESAHHFAEAFTEAGIPSTVVSGSTPREERRLILKRLHAGEIQVVWNCAVLTEGFDEPTVSCVVNARPTQSAPLYQQMVGRGLRPDLSLPPEQRGDCLVLDVVGVSRTHNLKTLIDLSSRPDVEEIDDEDLSLLEMEDALDAMEEAEEGGLDSRPEEYYGATAVEDFDPLARTGIGAWLQTAGGTYFLPAGDGAYVLIVESEEPALWDVAWLTKTPAGFLHASCPGQEPYISAYSTCLCGGRHVGSQGDLTEHQALSLDMACSWAEEVMEGIGGPGALTLASTKKRWRKGNVSDAQRNAAARMGIEVTPEMSKGDVSDLISTHVASRRIDPIVGFMKAAREGMK